MSTFRHDMSLLHTHFTQKQPMKTQKMPMEMQKLPMEIHKQPMEK